MGTTTFTESSAVAAGDRRVMMTTEEEINRLAKVLYDYQESVLPEGETWEELSESDRAIWRNSIKRVLQAMRDQERVPG